MGEVALELVVRLAVIGGAPAISEVWPCLKRGGELVVGKPAEAELDPSGPGRLVWSAPEVGAVPDVGSVFGVGIG
jgi:hypothetical protein